MFKVLFLPLLQIPSGHHHVADNIKEHLQRSSKVFHCEKVDILSHYYGNAETLISSLYLRSIHTLPTAYSFIYKTAAWKGKKRKKHFQIYEWLFSDKVLQLLIHRKPDVVICTHAFPSYLLHCLKKKNLWSGSVINVYTDYFINHLWGIDSIDYHFVPCIHLKKELMRRGIKSERIFVTSIPVHPIFTKEKRNRSKNSRKTVLISGGNMGSGSIQGLLHRLHPSGNIQYKVLCGKNKKLFQFVRNLNNSNITPLAYLSSRENMKQLYDSADAMITKPGGVTMSECIWSGLPIIVYEALPGQEEFNLQYLKSQKLIFHLDDWNSSNNVENNIIEILTNQVSHLSKNVTRFRRQQKHPDIAHIITHIVDS